MVNCSVKACNASPALCQRRIDNSGYAIIDIIITNNNFTPY